MLRLSFRIKSILSIFSLFLFISLIILTGQNFNQIHAQNDKFTRAQFEQECIRRNLLWDCSCDCQKDWVGGLAEEYRMCTTKEVDNSCKDSEPYFKVSFSGPNSEFSIVSNKNISSSNNFNFFPVLGQNGLLRVDENTQTVDLGASVKNILLWILYFLGVVAIFFVLYGGFLITTAGANEDRSGNGSRMMRNALIGVLISFGGILLVVGLSSALGIDTQQIDFNDNLQQINQPPNNDNITFDDIK